MITKQDVVKQLKFEASGNRRNSCKTVSTERRTSSRNQASSSGRGSQLVNLARLDTDQFEALLGEDTHPAAKKDCIKENQVRSKGEKIKKTGIADLNVKINTQANIYDDEDDHSEREPEKQVSVPEKEVAASEKQVNTNDSSEEPNNNAANNDRVDLLSVGTQTEPVSVMCGCDACKGLFHGVLSAINLAKTLNCQSHQAVSKHAAANPPEAKDFLTKPAENEKSTDEMVPLVKGCSVLIPLTKKSNLKLAIINNDPQEYVNELMDIFFTPAEMANMTADGRTKGSIKMDEDISDAMQAYIAYKYDKEKFNFDKYLFKEFVNAHCYNIRKKLWKQGDSQELGVRSRFPKNVKVNSNESGNDNANPKTPKTQRQKKQTPRRSKYKVSPKAERVGHRSTTGGKKPRYIMVEASTGKEVGLGQIHGKPRGVVSHSSESPVALARDSPRSSGNLPRRSPRKLTQKSDAMLPSTSSKHKSVESHHPLAREKSLQSFSSDPSPSHEKSSARQSVKTSTPRNKSKSRHSRQPPRKKHRSEEDTFGSEKETDGSSICSEHISLPSSESDY